MSGVMADGSIMTSKLNWGHRKGLQGHYSDFAIRRGIVTGVVYPDDSNNSDKERVEYILQDIESGQRYSNAIDMKKSGGKYNYERTIRKNVENKPGKLDEYAENLDGEAVFYAFVDGHSESPIILGASDHPFNAAYKKAKRSDGRCHVFEYNGVEFLIDKNGTLTLKQVGLKNQDGSIANSDAIGAEIKIDGGDGSIKISKGADLIELASGGVLNITVSGAANIISSTATVKASGAVTVDAASISLKSPANAVKGGLVPVAAANNDPITGIPLTACGGVTAD